MIRQGHIGGKRFLGGLGGPCVTSGGEKRRRENPAEAQGSQEIKAAAGVPHQEETL